MLDSDETQIRRTLAECAAGACAGEVERILPYLAEDLVFLLPGEPPLKGRPAFLSFLRDLITDCRIEAESEIRELKLMGDYAYSLNWLSLTLTPRATHSPRRRCGFTMSLLRREPDGQWVVFRDLNMLTEL
jgi:uncharacterized protein (TIGR02246 family)